MLGELGRGGEGRETLFMASRDAGFILTGMDRSVVFMTMVYAKMSRQSPTCSYRYFKLRQSPPAHRQSRPPSKPK